MGGGPSVIAAQPIMIYSFGYSFLVGMGGTERDWVERKNFKTITVMS